MKKRTSASNAGLPVGVRFNPTDQQLIVDYLLNKVQGKPLPSSTAIIDCDIYGEGHAWRQLFEESEENSLYFFTRLKKKTEKGKRIDRVTDCGTWKGQQRDKEIFSDGGRKVHIGSKRSFSFIPKKGVQETRGKWVMHEYRLEGCLLDRKNNFYVLCRINRKSKRRTATHDDDDLVHDVNGAVICAPTDVQYHHFNHVNHVSDCMGGDGLNVSYYMEDEPLNVVHGDGTKECLNGSDYVTGDGLNASDCMASDGLNVCNYMGGERLNVGHGDGSKECLNVADYMRGDGTKECLNGGAGLNVSNYIGGDGNREKLNGSEFECKGGDDTATCLNVSNYMGGDDSNFFNYMGGDGIGECLYRCDGLNVSNYMGGNGFGENLNGSKYMGGDGNGACLNVSNNYLGGNGLNFSNCLGGDGTGECLNASDYVGDGLNVFDYTGGDDIEGCFNASDHYIRGEGIGECSNVSNYMGRNGLQQQQSSSTGR
uniref:NAC transcription factor 28 n=1 Tax=Litchi chinensis TaxID=151069 RepID=A0A8K1HZC2_LITCN|nr:NAC transcription factor 28 [Litchi chinensis]